MQHLPYPVSPADDDAVIKKLAKQPQWTAHEAAWLTAYQTYRANGGNPFIVVAHAFGAGIGDLQYALYDSRKNTGQLQRMRRQAGLKSCPVCGSPTTGALDHYLPRAMYPEFSIMRANLIPACGHCNSGVKGTTVHGGQPRRFIHPYYDSWASTAIWFVEAVAPFKAATFRPHPMPTLPPPRDQIVSFHLENVLGTQFHNSMGGYWSSLPLQVKLRDKQLTIASVTNEITIASKTADATEGVNSWRSALMRGILLNPNAIAYLQHAAVAAIVP